MNAIDDFISTLIYDYIRKSESVDNEEKEEKKSDTKSCELYRKISEFLLPNYDHTVTEYLSIKDAANKLSKLFKDYPEFEDEGVIANIVGLINGEIKSVKTVKVFTAYDGDVTYSIETSSGIYDDVHTSESVCQILLPKEMTPADRLRKLSPNTTISQVIVSGETFKNCYSVNGGVLHIDVNGNVKVFDVEDVESFTF